MISMVAVVTVVAIISIVTKTNLGFYSGQDLMLQGTDEYGNTPKDYAEDYHPKMLELFNE